MMVRAVIGTPSAVTRGFTGRADPTAAAVSQCCTTSRNSSCVALHKRSVMMRIMSRYGPVERWATAAAPPSPVQTLLKPYYFPERRSGTALFAASNSAAIPSGGNSSETHVDATDPEEKVDSQMPKLSRSTVIDKVFQKLLWSSRNFVLAAVIGSLVMSGLMFLQGLAGVAGCAKEVVQASVGGHFTLEHPDVALACVEILDKFLAGIVTLIFGIGVYELFINQIDMGEEKDGSRTERPQWLHIRGIEDLEMRLGKVVITILVVNLMAAAKKVLPTHPSHLVYIGGALFLAACALTVLHWVDGQHS